MVAHKGPYRRHFQHAAEADGATCSSAGETALHKFAKETLQRALKLRLEGLTESDGRHSVVVVKEQEFEFDDAVLEKREGDIVPDVVCRKGDRILYVEFKVTHGCDSEKLEKLRRLGVGALEIDLSRYRDCPLAELGNAILTEAPRVWLHNPKIPAARNRLEELERERLAAIDEKARELLAKLPTLQGPASTVGVWEEAAALRGLADAVSPGRRAIGFAVREQEWKSLVLLQFGLVAVNGFTVKEAFAAIKKEGWVARPLAFVSDEVADGLRRVAGDIVTPWEALAEFIEKMKKAGMLMVSGPGRRLHGGRLLRTTIRSAIETRERPARRTEELKRLVDRILLRVRKAYKENFDFRTWLDSDIGDGTVPAATVASETEDSFDLLVERLSTLSKGMSSYPPHLPEGMTLGLPVLDEVADREKSRRESEDRRDREAAETVKREADDRESRLLRPATAAMGAEAAGGWMDLLRDDLQGVSPRVMARRSEADFWKAVDALDRWREAQRIEIEREELKADSLAKLRKAARADFKRDDYADLWMRQPHKGLSGTKPEEYCVDDATLAACVALLPGSLRRR
ncbi:hypothetical protein RFM26_03180 [Mesorhizobium sp. VK23B]|uniref:DUF2384 domain-containing protein n=1 Tax=Mesorhizobium dulcispinae TaxID=3072316 RepID=A0ABU4XBY5_9HYPH|nr:MULTISPECIES: hypothetical protein [unclassified Mesorhizobium]MDX8464683.1 hypothetical protein [Mesorhizobium sp. VK23B]MDX8471069.1 hypothetical protein [Mesorhizobium sp. VK23A]